MARELFERRGFEGTTTRDISTGARIATGTLFNYFEWKEAIVLCLDPGGVRARAGAFRADCRRGAESRGAPVRSRGGEAPGAAAAAGMSFSSGMAIRTGRSRSRSEARVDLLPVEEARLGYDGHRCSRGCSVDAFVVVTAMTGMYTGYQREPIKEGRELVTEEAVRSG
ncbi:MAG: helix-turn-helix transcriptional regulator [Candidatus Riflebacteria bacterium]|nr:helix-turn-helix transcriptional regulator [Candidatus Riflebacteria bacterium]